MLSGDTTVKFLAPDTFVELTQERIPFGTGLYFLLFTLFTQLSLIHYHSYNSSLFLSLCYYLSTFYSLSSSFTILILFFHTFHLSYLLLFSSSLSPLSHSFLCLCAGFGSPVGVGWSPDAQLVHAVSSEGSVLLFLASFPTLYASCGSLLAHRSSLREITVLDVREWQSSSAPTGSVVVPVAAEPELLAVSLHHVAVGLNSHAWIYRYADNGVQVELIYEHDYTGTITQMRMNSTHFAVLVDGHAYVLALAQTQQNQPHAGEKEPPSLRILPERGDTHTVTSVAFAADFFVYSTDDGRIVYHSLLDWGEVNDYRCPAGLVSVTPNRIGTRCVCFDEQSRPFVYSPVTDTVLPLPSTVPLTNTLPITTSTPPISTTALTHTTQKEKESSPDTQAETAMRDVRYADTILWDQSELLTFTARIVGQQAVATLVCSPDLYGGAVVSAVGVTPIPLFMHVVGVHGGYVYFQSPAGELFRTQLETHRHLSLVSSAAPCARETALKCFHQCLSLYRLKDAWTVLLRLDDAALVDVFAQHALRMFDIEYAVAAFRLAGNAACVGFYERLLNCDDKNLLSGYIALMAGEKDRAQRFFLRSSAPVAALEMRCDAMEWEAALGLAAQLARSRVPEISLHYAQQLETRGDYQKAQKYYASAHTHGATPAHDTRCMGGVARTKIRTGEIRAGMDAALATDTPSVLFECAALLESMKLLDDAACLYERGGNHAKAAELYLSTRNIRALGPVLAQISTPLFHLQYGRLLEHSGDTKGATREYLAADDIASAARVLVGSGAIAEAQALVRRTRSTEAARVVALRCAADERTSEAVEFLVLARCFDDAFALAVEHDCMEEYAHTLTRTDAAVETRQRERERAAQTRTHTASVHTGRVGSVLDGFDLAAAEDNDDSEESEDASADTPDTHTQTATRTQ